MRQIEELLQEAFAHHGAGRLKEAANIYDTVLGHTDGQDPTAAYGYGTILAGDGYPGLAVSLFYRALRANPQFVPAWTNLGIALKALHRDKAALAAYLEALRLAPEDYEVLVNLAGWYVNRGEPEKVVEHARLAVQLYPDKPQGHNQLSQGLLELARYKEAWPHYEWRWQLPERAKDKRPYKAPLWQGQEVGTLAIHGEQGLGDEILFMSCLRAVRPRARRVVVEAAKRLVPLFTEAFGVPCYADHAALIAAEGEPDAYIPMGSLPGIVGMPDGRPYLPRGQRAGNGRCRVGIAWRGGTDKTYKRQRTLKLEQLRPVLDLPGFDFISVQYGDGVEVEQAEAAGLAHTPIGRDFEAAHLAIQGCDLIITVQQTAVHQAGAMGIPCWVLVPKATSWQFNTVHGDRMPWYDSVRLFRQGDDERWEPVVAQIAEALRTEYALAA